MAQEVAIPAPVGRPRGTNIDGLWERLHSGALTADDKRKLELTKGLRAGRAQGLSLAACSRQLGVTESQIHQFVRRGVYTLLCQYLDALEVGADKGKTEVIVQKAKNDFAGFAPDAIDFYRTAFLRNPEEAREEKGEWRDSALAQWATEKVSKGLGLTEPEQAVRPIVHIEHAYIRIETSQVSEDDAEAARAARAIDVTPEP